MNKYTKLISFVVIIILATIGFGLFLTQNNKTNSENKSNDKIQVVASFYPLYNFASVIGGDNIEIRNITPFGVDSHDFEPSTSNIRSIVNSKLFLYNGSGFEPWAQNVSIDAGKNGVKTVEISTSFDLLSGASDEGGDEEEFDPHIWLDPVNAKEIAVIIRDQLIKIDSKNIDIYKNNADKYFSELSKLDEEYRNGLKSCKKSEIIVSHNAFSYLGKRYGFSVESLAGLEPSDEPSSKEIAGVVELVKKQDLKYVFYENTVSPKIAETVAKETGTKTLILRSLESITEEEEKNGENYITLMRGNLRNLKLGLECE